MKKRVSSNTTGKTRKVKEYEEHLFDLYKLYDGNEKHFLQEHQKYVAFFMSLISALLAATVAGVTKTDEWYYCVLMMLGPLAMLVVSYLAIDGTGRIYQRFLESITMLKKIQYDLGMNIPRKKEGNWIEAECLLVERHKKSFAGNSSSDWVHEKMEKGKNYYNITSLLFRCTRILAIILIISIVLISYIKFNKQSSAVNQKAPCCIRQHGHDRHH